MQKTSSSIKNLEYKTDQVKDYFAIGTGLGVYACAVVINEVIQQSRHLYLHLTRAKHERITDESISSFPYYERSSS